MSIKEVPNWYRRSPTKRIICIINSILISLNNEKKCLRDEYSSPQTRSVHQKRLGWYLDSTRTSFFPWTEITNSTTEHLPKCCISLSDLSESLKQPVGRGLISSASSHGYSGNTNKKFDEIIKLHFSWQIFVKKKRNKTEFSIYSLNLWTADLIGWDRLTYLY